jgi:hypothetical protein
MLATTRNKRYFSGLIWYTLRVRITAICTPLRLLSGLLWGYQEEMEMASNLNALTLLQNGAPQKQSVSEGSATARTLLWIWAGRMQLPPARRWAVRWPAFPLGDSVMISTTSVSACACHHTWPLGTAPLPKCSIPNDNNCRNIRFEILTAVKVLKSVDLDDGGSVFLRCPRTLLRRFSTSRTRHWTVGILKCISA